MKITWLGHSCMKLSENGYSVVCDPYERGAVPGTEMPPVSADRVLCSHEHHDHNARAMVEKTDSGAYPFRVTAVPAWHDKCEGAQRGPNIIHIIDTDFGIRAVHLGDLGDILTEEQAAAIGRPDVLMVPVGGFYTIDAAEAKKVIEQLSPRVVIPMHFRGEGFGYDVIGTAEQFISQFDETIVRRYPGNSIEIDEDTPAQIALLTLEK